MKKTIFFLFVLGLFVNAYSQEALWSVNYSTGIGIPLSNPPKIFPESESVFKVIGSVATSNEVRLKTVKYDISGSIISEQIFEDAITDYMFDNLGHLYVLSWHWYAYAQTKLVIHKYDLNGDLLWTEEIQDTGYFYEPLHISITENNTIFITSKKYIYQYEGPYVDDELSYRLYAYDTDGNQLWERIFDGFTIYDDLVYENEIYLLGYTQIIKVDTDNNLNLNVSIDTQGFTHGKIYLTPDNKLLIVYSTHKMLKLDLNGNLLWLENYSFFPEDSTFKRIKTIRQDENGNIYMTGSYEITNQSYLITVKFDSNGNVLWQYLYPNGSFSDFNNYTIIFKNGYIYVGGGKNTGISSSDYLILKINAETGDLSGTYIYEGTGEKKDYVSSIYAFDDNKIVLTGLTYNGTYYDWITQLLSESSFSIDSPNYSQTINLYPNPLDENQVLSIEAENLKSYTVYSLTGQLLQQGKFESGSFHTIQLQNLTKGVYLLKLNNDRQTLTKKIVIR